MVFRQLFAGVCGLPSSKTTMLSIICSTLTPKIGHSMTLRSCRRFHLLAQTEDHILRNGILAFFVVGEDGGEFGFKVCNFDPRIVIGKQINPSPTHVAGDVRRIESEI